LPPPYAAPALPEPFAAGDPTWRRTPAALGESDGWATDAPVRLTDIEPLGPDGPPAALPRCEMLPLHLLWQPPLAGLRQPRMYVMPTSLDNDFTQQTIDTAIGGTIGLFRYRPTCWPESEFQLDFFGAHFSRWSERHLAVAGDYRYGFPVTFASGPWQAKLGYEHTSTHLGDDFIKSTGRFKVQYVRDDLVFGLAYRWWEQFRVYGEIGMAAYLGTPYSNGRERFAWGLEWSRQHPTGWKGQPFAAFNMDLRPEQDYSVNVSFQAGWQWIPEHQRVSARLALELYHGKSPYGQFLQDKERWVGLGFFLDF
jgi:hypothetical protein